MINISHAKVLAYITLWPLYKLVSLLESTESQSFKQKLRKQFKKSVLKSE